jgi:hypothetical protein
MGSYHIRDGPMAVNGSGGRTENYEPRTASGPVEDKKFAWHQHPVQGTTGRYPY